MVRNRAAVACIVLVASNLVASAGAAEDWSGLYLGGAMSAGRLKSSTSYLGQYESLWSERSFEVGEDRLTVRNVDDVITIGAHASDTGDIGPAAGLVFGGNFRLGRAVAGVEFNFDWADFTNVSTAHVEATATRTHTTVQSTNGGPFVPILNYEESHTEKAELRYHRNWTGRPVSSAAWVFWLRRAASFTALLAMHGPVSATLRSIPVPA